MSATADSPPPLDLRRPFTREAGIAAGIPWSTIRGPLFRRVLPGLYVSASLPRRPLERVEAALAFHPAGAWASHTSAARVYGLPVPDLLVDEHVTVTRRADRRSRRGVRSHLTSQVARVAVLHGVRVSEPERLFVEMAGLLHLVELVVFGDALVSLHPVSPTDLVEAARTSRDRHARAARRGAAYVRAGVDSPMESRLRMLLVLAGLPEPVVNLSIVRQDGTVRYRFDLSYPALRLAIEYDGRQHRADLDQWDRDLERDDWLDHHDWMIVRVVARGIYLEPDKTIHRVRRALRSRGLTLPAAQDTWRPFFPVRSS